MVFFEVLSNRQSLYESVHRKETDLERKLRNEKRVLEYLEKAKSKTETIDTVKQLNVVWGLPEQVCLVMNDLINLIVRDFIYFWMDNFTKNREFGINVKNLLTDIFGALGNKLQGIAPQTAIQLVEDSIQLVHVHLCIFREATVLVKKNDNVDTRNEVIRQYFADHQFLHPACTGAPNVEEVYLNGIAVEILQELKSDFCMTNNFFVRTFKVLLREVLAGAILKPILGFAEPYYINLLIIQMMNTKVDENNTHPEHASKMKDTNGKKYQANPKRGSMVHEYGKDPLTRTGSSKLKSTSRKVVKKMVELSLNKPGIRKLHKAEEHPENFMSKMKGAADKLMEAKLEITSRSGELHEFVEACGIVLTDGLRTENNQCNTDISVWNYIQEDRWRSPATSLHSKMVAKLPEAISCSTLDAKSTQWILCALQKGTLSQHIEALTQDTDMSDTYYNPEAAIRDRDLMAKVVRVLSPLGTLSFPFESIASLLNLDATNVAIDVSAVCAEYIFEYERYIPLNGWNKSLLLEHPPWTTLNGLACEKESDLLPDSTWYWQDAWTACSEGWQYGRTFHDQFHGAKKPFDTVRKRRWVRHRKQFESVLQARDAQHEVLEEMSPIQEPLGIDDDAPQFSNGSSCMECDQDITRLGLGLSYRRHHCRNCGKSFCEQCVRYRIEVPLRQYHGTGPQRVCISCYDTIAERKVVPDRFNMADFFVIKEKRIQAYIKSYASNAFTLHVSVGRDHTWTVQRTDDEFSQLYQHLLSKRDEQIAHGLFHIDLVNFKELDDVPSLSARPALAPTTEDCITGHIENVNAILNFITRSESVYKSSLIHHFLSVGDHQEFKESNELSPTSTKDNGKVKLFRIEYRIFTLLDEVFELDEMNLVRRKLFTVSRRLLRLSLQGSFHRYIRHLYTQHTQPASIAHVLTLLQDTIWPNGEFRQFDEPLPTTETLANTEALAKVNLFDSVPDALESLLGEKCCKNACRKVHEFVQLDYLVKSVCYSILDLFMIAVFGTKKQI